MSFKSRCLRPAAALVLVPTLCLAQVDSRLIPIAPAAAEGNDIQLDLVDANTSVLYAEGISYADYGSVIDLEWDDALDELTFTNFSIIGTDVDVDFGNFTLNNLFKDLRVTHDDSALNFPSTATVDASGAFTMTVPVHLDGEGLGDRSLDRRRADAGRSAPRGRRPLRDPRECPDRVRLRRPHRHRGNDYGRLPDGPSAACRHQRRRHGRPRHLGRLGDDLDRLGVRWQHGGR